MFPPVDPVWFQVATMALAGISVIALVRATTQRTRRRTAELEGAAQALTTHYEAFAAVVDDPALPMPALEMLTTLSESISDRDFCDVVTDIMTTHAPPEATKEAVPIWFDELERLRKTRPELVANVHKAIGAGLAAAVLRWPGNASRLAAFTAMASQGERKEAVLAERAAEMARARHHHPSNGAMLPA